MSKRFRKLSHTLYECKYHVVFCPKYRYRILKDGVAEYTRQQIYQLVRQKDGVEELNVQADHIHLVAWIPPKYAVSEVLGYLKGKLATRLFREYERFYERAVKRKIHPRLAVNPLFLGSQPTTLPEALQATPLIFFN
ncbi:MAG: IS200/IS605 family transposase, partial [Pyrinomonadaceae bacterium]